jgi:hypothetical protein
MPKDKVTKARAGLIPASDWETPADPEGQNDDRALWAEAAIRTFQEQTGLKDVDGMDTAVMDLLADIGHFCDRHNLSLSGLLHRAKMHYDEETNPEGCDEDDPADVGPQGTQFDFPGDVE